MGRERVCSTVFFLKFLVSIKCCLHYYPLNFSVFAPFDYQTLFMRLFGPSSILFIKRCLFPLTFSVFPTPIELQVRPAHFSLILLFRYAFILSLLSFFHNSLSEPRLKVDNCFGAANFSKQSAIKNLY